MKAKRKGLSLSPQKINENAWYYENPRSIDVMYAVVINDRIFRTDHIRIPARKLEASLRRMNEVKI